jgi:hypothetical protein
MQYRTPGSRLAFTPKHHRQPKRVFAIMGRLMQLQ